MKGGSIMNNIIEYAKEAKNAFKTYINSQEIDNDLCEKIYEYIQKIESLDDTEKEELDAFINNNTFSVVANIYINKERKKTLKNQLIRMTPFSIAKPDSRIYKARGDLSPLINPQNQKIKLMRKKAA